MHAMETCVDLDIFQVVSRATDIAMMMTNKKISSRIYRTALSEILRLHMISSQSTFCEMVLNMTTDFIHSVFRESGKSDDKKYVVCVYVSLDRKNSF